MKSIKPLILNVIAAVAAGLAHDHAAGSEAPQPWVERGRADIIMHQPAHSPGQIIGKCRGEVTPDRALIAGGVTAESVKPLEAKAQLEKQLAEMQRYVSSQGGTMVMQEQVRAIHQTTGRPQRRNTPGILPFLVLQRLEFEFPANADIDGILQQLLQLGFDRYGKAIRLQHGDYGPQVVVYYRFTTMRDALEEIHRRCKVSAVKKWCEEKGHADDALCQAGPTAVGQHLITQSLSLHSQPILSAHGGNSIVVHYPWRSEQLEGIELLGNVPLRLVGTIVLARPKAPAE